MKIKIQTFLCELDTDKDVTQERQVARNVSNKNFARTKRKIIVGFWIILTFISQCLPNRSEFKFAAFLYSATREAMNIMMSRTDTVVFPLHHLKLHKKRFNLFMMKAIFCLRLGNVFYYFPNCHLFVDKTLVRFLLLTSNPPLFKTWQKVIKLLRPAMIRLHLFYDSKLFTAASAHYCLRS